MRASTVALVDALMMGVCGRPVRLAAMQRGPAGATLLRRDGRRCSGISMQEVAEVAADAESPAVPEVDAGPTMEEVINVCKRRGIIFQSSEVRTHSGQALPRCSC